MQLNLNLMQETLEHILFILKTCPTRKKKAEKTKKYNNNKIVNSKSAKFE